MPESNPAENQSSQLSQPHAVTGVPSATAEVPQWQSLDDQWLCRIFLGKQGLRAGWSIVIFLAMVLLCTAIFMTVGIRYLHLGVIDFHNMRPRPAILQELAMLLAVLVASLVMTRVEKKPLVSYGLEGRRRALRFFSGLLCGFAAISVLVGTMTLCGFLVFEPLHLAGFLAWKYAALWGVEFFLVGLYEESLMRGYLQSALARGIGFWWGALLLSALFGCVHLSNMGESPVGIFSAAAVGLVFCLSLYYLKTLWWAIGFHASWDWGQSYFYGTADSGTVVHGHLLACHPQGYLLWSGGETGPEGSLLILPLLLLAAALMYLAWGRKKPETTVSPAASNRTA
jgi:hypothetical protein